MTPQECPKARPLTNPIDVQSTKSKKIPAFHDWKDYGKISPVKNQGTYGSCWAFSAVGSLEAFWNIKKLGVPNTTFS